jgi:hypothetical protein
MKRTKIRERFHIEGRDGRTDDAAWSSFRCRGAKSFAEAQGVLVAMRSKHPPPYQLRIVRTRVEVVS